MTWPILLQASGIIIALVAGFGGTVPVVNWIKRRFSITGRGSQTLAVGVSVGFALATLVVQGVLAPETLTVDNMAVLFVAVFTASQAEYRRLKDKA